MRRATTALLIQPTRKPDFYPRSPCGERPIRKRQVIPIIQFLSTLSLRRATRFQSFCQSGKHYFYPRSPCGERPIIQKITILTIAISIHALLAESDALINCNSNFTQKFLSTLSLRRATAPWPARLAARLNFYPRSPCGERRSLRQLQSALRRDFYPRSPCGERHAPSQHPCPRSKISIHALLAESDICVCWMVQNRL